MYLWKTEFIIDNFRASSNFALAYVVIRGTWWHSWLRQCASSEKMAGSIPGDAIVILH
jgi:hypothetical protein